MPVTSPPTDADLAALRASIEADLPAFLADLKHLVNIDCGSYVPAGVDEVGRWTGEFMESIGARVDYRPDPDGRLGSTVIGTSRGAPVARVLLIGHMDTVFEPGTPAARPFRLDGNIATGPGVTDMKAGLLAGLYALRAIGELPFERLTFIANPDEEVGSPTSTPTSGRRPRTPTLRSSSNAAAPTATSCRRGRVSPTTGSWSTAARRTRDRTREGPSRDPRGRRVVREAQASTAVARRDVQRRHDPGRHAAERRPGPLRACDRNTGGHRPRPRRVHRGDPRARGHVTEVPGTTIDVSTEFSWRPMERTDQSARLVEHTKSVAERLGFTVNDAATGGASDANTTAGMGVPSLDGLGPVGGNDHAPSEYLEVDRSCRARRCSAACSSSLLPTPPNGAPGPLDSEPAPHLVGRAVGGDGVLQSSDRRRRRVLGRGHDRRRSRRPRPSSDDVAAQAGAVFDIIETALIQAGFAFSDIVRLRMFITDMSRKDELMAVQAERFRDIRPAATLVEISALIDLSLLVEIEVDAQR